MLVVGRRRDSGCCWRHDGAETPCDAGLGCCCDIDVALPPTCAHGGFVCPPTYTFLFDCSECTRREPTDSGNEVEAATDTPEADTDAETD